MTDETDIAKKMPKDAFSVIRSEPENWALFLDIDGTLIDLAETPDGIVVPKALPTVLEKLSKKFSGALALVTGRSISLADSLFSPHQFPLAGLHGTERRRAGGSTEKLDIPQQFQQMKQAITVELAGLPGVLFEDKGAAVAAHYRQAPEYAEEAKAIMARHTASLGEDWHLQHGKMVVEIRPARADKGHALEAFLEEEPFKGRRPLAIGDDVTDEAMFSAANSRGGYSIRVGEADRETEARHLVDSPSAIRSLLEELIQ